MRVQKLTRVLLFGLSALLSGRAGSAAAQTSSAAEEVQVIQSFSEDPALDRWTALNRATIAVANGHLTLAYPKYAGGDEQWPRAERDVSERDFSRFNGLEIEVENPNDATQGFDVVLRDGKGAEGYLCTSMEPRTRRTLRLRCEDIYNQVDWSDIRHLIIMRTTPDTNYVWHVYRVALFRDDLRRTPRAAAETALERAQQAVAQVEPLMGDDAVARDTMNTALAEWRQRLEPSDALRGRLPEARVALAAIAAQAARVKASADAKSQADPALLAWSVVPGQTFRPAEAMLQYRGPSTALSIQAARGEYGEALLRLTNVSSLAQDVRITTRGPGDATLPPLSLRRNLAILARDGTRCGDALAPLDASGVVTLPAQETAELWVRADVKHSPWPVGTHRFTLEARDLRRPAAPVTALPLDVTVLAVDLGLATPMRAHFWPEISHPRSWIVHGRERAARDNLADYGANAVTFVDSDLPWPKFTADGGIESIAFGHHDEVIRFYRQADPPQMLIYWLAMDTGKDENWRLRGGFEPGSPPWRSALRNWLTAWTQHLAELGVPPEEYAFYVTDEPNREEYDRTVLFAEVAKSVSPTIRIYVNGSHDLAEDPVQAERLLQLVDIWQPDEVWQSPALRKALQANRQVERWVYRCAMSRRNYDVNAHDYYRLMAWRALRDGVTGIAYWTYCATHPGEDPWDETKGTASGGIMVYPDAAQGLIMSARWELVRMALDDARYVDLLRRTQPREEAQRRAVEALLHERMAQVIGNPDRPELLAEWRLEAGRLLEAIAR